MHTSRISVALAGGALATTLLVGCSGGTTAESESSSSGATSVAASAHNAADVEFNTMMIPHHEQAVEMAGLVDTRTDNADIRLLAAEISAAQGPEIGLMSARLRAWGVDPDDAQGGHGGHAGHGGMPGMLSDDDLAKLRAARGAAFDRLWLAAMIRHHEGAIAMANAEMTDGQDPASKVLAQQIKAAQRAEIDTMKRLLAG